VQVCQPMMFKMFPLEAFHFHREIEIFVAI
jgi:hypothetical protein